MGKVVCLLWVSRSHVDVPVIILYAVGFDFVGLVVEVRYFAGGGYGEDENDDDLLAVAEYSCC